MSRTRIITLAFLLLLVVSLCFVFALISCPLCNSNALQNIKWYLVEMKNRTRQCVAYKNDNLLWNYLSLLYLTMGMY